MPKGSTVPALRPVADDVQPEGATLPEPRFDGRDAVAALGLLVLVGGVALIYVPASLIVLGAALLVVAWLT